METTEQKNTNAQGAGVTKTRNYSLPEEFIKELIANPKMNDTFWKIAKEEPDMKIGMLIALTKREWTKKNN